MVDDAAKRFLHGELHDLREVMVWKLAGLSEYDVRRPLTSTGTNLLGLVKHLTNPSGDLTAEGPADASPAIAVTDLSREDRTQIGRDFRCRTRVNS